MAVKKVAELQSFDELGLSSALQKSLADYSPADVVRAARKGKIEQQFKGIGRKKAAEIAKCVREAGYIYIEDTQSFGIRRLMAAIDPEYKERLWSDEEYERRQRVKSWQVEAVFNRLRYMHEERRTFIIRRFSVDGQAPLTPREIGVELKMPYERVIGLERRAIQSVKHSYWNRFSGYFPEILLPDYNPDPDSVSDSPVDSISVAKLKPPCGMPAYVLKALRKAYIDSVGQLRRMTVHDVGDIQGMDYAGIYALKAALHQIEIDDIKVDLLY